MIREALEYLVGLANRQPYREAIAGLEYSDCELKVIKPPRPEPLRFSRLQALADYVKLAPKEAIIADDYLIHVESPTSVRYFSYLTMAIATASNTQSRIMRFKAFPSKSS
ncbi:MAG TPA: hypothetical protein VKS22_16190 [Candidatus Binataceae bacterium]|nr:hypothetical protein [Candidatus Binataceae bacterium]